ncbi:MAG TPA: guanylate kinase [Candidatus Obscuribacterales bacterium]
MGTNDHTLEERAAESPGRGNLFVITGPSGVGKGTVVSELLHAIPNLKRSCSVTTRDKRAGEREGDDYFFRTPDEFEKMKAEGHFLEWAEFAGNCYGTPKQWVIEQLTRGFDVILVIEVQGAKQVRVSFPPAILVFLAPPSFEELEKRLRGRNTESEAKIKLRLKKAEQELSEKHLFHYEVVNDDVTAAVNNLQHIVYAERCRIRSNKVPKNVR